MFNKVQTKKIMNYKINIVFKHRLRLLRIDWILWIICEYILILKNLRKFL